MSTLNAVVKFLPRNKIGAKNEIFKQLTPTRKLVSKSGLTDFYFDSEGSDTVVTPNKAIFNFEKFLTLARFQCEETAARGCARLAGQLDLANVDQECVAVE